MNNDSSDIAGIQQKKQNLRESIEHALSSVSGQQGVTGRCAEMLRRQDAYRNARQVFVSPVPALQQVRINCLLDGKEVVVPGPGMKEGFYLLKPYTVSFADLPFAVSVKGLTKFGRKLTQKEVGKLDIALLATTAVAVDLHGRRLGDGNGFFDLCHAILASFGALQSQATVFCLVHGDQIGAAPVPVCCWDVPVHKIVMEKEMVVVQDASPPPGRIFWQHLPEKRIRKMTPLWWLRKQDE